ncbi:MAG: glycogen debranching enzyme N-terminal domain-containing protein, partial [Phycisphaerales bacterium]|nr:glycogen debranching enzyme N-terminal domain-containing protein [Phycisphaerales bacterium]
MSMLPGESARLPDGEGVVLPRPIAVRPDAIDAVSTEWLLTNGIGGFAMGTLLGVPTRRYHGLLVAAMRPPIDRIVALHSMDELVVIDRGSAAERRTNLTRFHFEDARERPRAHPALVGFERGAQCVWRYLVDGVTIEKRLHLFHGRNAVEIRYSVRAPGRRVRLHLRPLVALRDFHSLRRKATPDASVGAVDGTVINATGGAFECRRIGMGVVVVSEHRGLVITSDAPRFRTDQAWWTGLRYEREQDRGQDFVEDLWTPGEFTIDSQGMDHATTATVYATVDARPADTPGEDVQRRSARLRSMVEGVTRGVAHGDSTGAPTGLEAPTLTAVERLCAAGDEFVVPRGGSAADAYGHPGLTVLAGYPWFADWGRDSMICVPGLLIDTGRLGDAHAVLMTFARHIRDGVIPNRFDDHGGEAHYNTVDASLWFIHAVGELARAMGEPGGAGAPIDPMLVDACVEIVNAYTRGTHAGPATREAPGAAGDLSDAPTGQIRVDPTDGLVVAGDAETQLTWMDARRDGVSFTPRAGKAVEINALWYNALRLYEGWLAELRGDEAARRIGRLADRARESFNRRFWCDACGHLHDVVDGEGGDDPACRPNQIFAVSLPNPVLDEARWPAVLQVVHERLWTPVGLRSLAPGHADFKPRYDGDLQARDAAYHQGT